MSTPAPGGPSPAEDSVTATSHRRTTTHGSTGATTAATTGTRTPTTTARTLQYPGGRAGKDLLAAQHLLDPQGRLRFGSHPVDDPAASKAFCDYLVGTPKQVKEMTLLPGTVTLDAFSGYHYHSAGSTFECAYDVDGEPMLEIQVTNGPPLDPNSPGSPIIVKHAGIQASLSYRPDYDGSRLAKRLATEWLTQAAGLAVR